jgi:hypothetical protein
MGCGSGKATALCGFKCQLVARRACDLVMHCLKKRAEPPLGGDRVAARRAGDRKSRQTARKVSAAHAYAAFATKLTVSVKHHSACPKGIAVSDKEMDAINMTRAEFHGEWNYTIHSGDRSDRAVDSCQTLSQAVRL